MAGSSRQEDGVKKISFTKKSLYFCLFFFLFFAFNSCTFFTDSWNKPVKEYFKEYTETAAVTQYKIASADYVLDDSGAVVLSSSQDAVFNLYIRNPQQYKFSVSDNMFYSFERLDYDKAEKKLGEKPDFSITSLEQDSDLSILTLTYPAEFLAKSETGFDISPTINLKNPHSKADFGNYTSLKVLCNSPPPLIFGAVVYKDSVNSKYVVLFNMPSKSLLSGIHQDIVCVKINDFESAVKINEDGTFSFENAKFEKGNVSASFKPGLSDFVENGQPAAFYTEDIFTDKTIEYSLLLKDSAGLYTEVKTSIESVRLNPVILQNADGNEIASGESISQDEDISYATIKLVPASTAKDGSNSSDSIVVYEVYQGTDDSGKIIFSGKNSGGEKVLQIPAGENFVRVYSHKDLYADSVPVEYGIKVLKSTLYVSSSGSDSENNGSKSSPFATIMHAISSNGFDDITAENVLRLSGNISDSPNLNAPNANLKIFGNNGSITSFTMDSVGGTLEIQNCTINEDLNITNGTVKLKNCTINGNINYNGGSLVLEGDFALEGSIKIDTGLQIGIKNLTSLKTLKLSGKTDSEKWNVGTEVIHSVDGTVLSNLICSKFGVQNKTADNKALCIVPSSTDATKGVLSVAGASVVPSFGQPEYTLTLSPASFIPGNADNKVSLAVTDSDGNSVTPDSVEFALYQNKNKVAVLQKGFISSWIPEGKYTVIATAKIGGYSYDAEKNIIISKSIAISYLTSAPSASDFPKITASSSADMVKLGEWIKSGSDLEGITITLADDVDLSDCTDWQPIGFVSESENKPFKGTFDGRGHSLSFDISNIDSSNRFRKIGVFYKNDGVIENLVISQYLQDGKTLIVYGNSSQYAYSNAGGGICIENSGIVRNCINKSSIVASTFSDIGGICMANAETGIIENCLFSGSITMNAKCSNGGDNQKSAGICPRNNGIIKNCVSNGSITTEAETDQNLPDSILNNISGAISVYTEGFIENCYWLKNNIKSGSSNKNRIAYTKSTYKELTCIPDPSKITGCGYFDTNSPSASVTAGTTSECKSAQTLAYSGTLIQMLNAYVSASSDSGLKRWTADYSGKLTLDF